MGKYALELNKASGLWDSQAPGQKVSRAFMGRLMSGPYTLGVSGQRVGPTFLGRLVAGPFPFEILESGRLAMGVGPKPKVPTLYSFKESPLYLLRPLHLKGNQIKVIGIW